MNYQNPDAKCIVDWNNFYKFENPKEGKYSPFANQDTVNNCDFHKWSWQKFLYLTNVEGNTNDLIMFGENFIQVDNAMQPYHNKNLLILEDFTQASTNGQLFTLEGHDLVYYSIHINDTFYQNAIEAKNALINNHDIVPVNVEFDVGSVEIKASWVVITHLPLFLNIDISEINENFYTRNALIKKDGKLDSVEVALLGLHVVGIVENHPEFIWATFEHSLSAPDYYKGNPVTGNYEENTKPYNPNYILDNNTDYLFYLKGSPASDCLFEYESNEDGYACRMYKYGVPNGHPYTGNFPEYSATHIQKKQDLENFNNIRTLNPNVNNKLNNLPKKNNHPTNNSIWANYFYSGSIWLDTQNYVPSKVGI